MRHYMLAMAQPEHPERVPVITEGLYPNLAAALADNPGFHEATDDEYAAYERYWTQACARCAQERGDHGTDHQFEEEK